MQIKYLITSFPKTHELISYCNNVSYFFATVGTVFAIPIVKQERTMTMETTSSMLPLYDINLAAFLQHRGIVPSLQQQGSRVVFLFKNDTKTHELMRLYNENPAVPVLDFVGHLRRLRSQMLSMRSCTG